MSEIIYVTAVIDAKALYKNYKDKPPSKDPTKPTPIDHCCYGFLMTERKYAYGNPRGTADLILKVKPGDSVRFSATSESNNFEEVVILYAIGESDTWTNSQFISNYKRPMILPSNSKITDFTTELRKYAIVSLNIIDEDIRPYRLRFVLYERVSENDKYFNIFGYFEFFPTIMIEI